MAKLEFRCPVCTKRVELVKEDRVEVFFCIFKTYSCGHMVTEEIVSLKPAEQGYKLVCVSCLVNLSDPKLTEAERSSHLEHNLQEIQVSRDLNFARLMPFQQAGVEFIEQSNFNCAVNDEQGLGKTVQILQAVAHSRDKLTPTLYVVKSKLKLNWAQEMIVNGWLCDKNDLADYPFIVMDGKMCIIPGFKHYIISMSMLEKNLEMLKSMGFKLLVVDESQNFANMTSKRTKALLELARTIPHKICASGTPILNRASEYWPTLNLIRPDQWNNFAGFLKQWIDFEITDGGSKRYTGLKVGMRNWFFDKTKNYIIRRNKRDVMKDLPPFRRTFEVVDISTSMFKVAYNKEAEKLEEYINSVEYMKAKAQERNTTILGHLMKMRHLTGLAKTPSLIEDILEFLETTEDKTEKLIVGVHHDDVMDQLKAALAIYNPIILGAGLDDSDTMVRIREFSKPENRVCLAKILAAGEGLNLQFCTNMIVFERMWNAGKEEQFEARIDRPLKCPNDKLLLSREGEVLFCKKCDHKEPVVAKVATYKIAKDTVDEEFTEMVESKRRISGETVNKDFNFEADPVVMSLLAERVSRRRIK